MRDASKKNRITQPENIQNYKEPKTNNSRRM